MDSNHSWSDIVDSITPLAMGLGLLTFILFPLALPLVILTIAATLPLLVPIALLGALAAALWGVRLGMRAAGRGVRQVVAPRAERPRRVDRPTAMTAEGLEVNAREWLAQRFEADRTHPRFERASGAAAPR